MLLLPLLGFATVALGQFCLKKPPPSGLRCGVLGDFTRPNNYRQGGGFVGAAFNENVEQCAQSCQEISGCRFFRYLKGSTQCEFWKYSGERLGFKAEKNGSWYGYNLNCFVTDGFAGLQWAYFDGSQIQGIGDNPNGPDFDDKTLYQEAPLQYSGVTDFVQQGYDLTGQDLSSLRFEDQYTGSGTDFILDYHGYIVMPTTGRLIVALTQFNGHNFFAYVGPTAYRGFSNTNALFEMTTDDDDGGSGDASTTVTTLETYEAGSYVPIRFIWTQADDSQSGGFHFQITGPDGTSFFPVDPSAGNVVRQSCDGTTAPAFPPYPAVRKA